MNSKLEEYYELKSMYYQLRNLLDTQISKLMNKTSNLSLGNDLNFTLNSFAGPMLQLERTIDNYRNEQTAMDKNVSKTQDKEVPVSELSGTLQCALEVRGMRVCIVECKLEDYNAYLSAQELPSTVSIRALGDSNSSEKKG